MSVLCELTNTELGLVAGGDAGFMIVLDDAGTTTFSGTGFSQPTASSISVAINGFGDVNGEFEASFSVFSNTGPLED